MVQTRAATKRIKSGQGPPQGTIVISSSVKKRQRGKPGALYQLNHDVLLLIVAYIHRPLDLLHLARTCKFLRRILMDKSSAFVWKNARGQVEGLPDCPIDLTEPEYADLVFCTPCHGCGIHAENIKTLWSIRRRYCPDCRWRRLRCRFSCPDVVRNNNVLPMETITLNGERREWVDQEKLDTFMREYDCSSDKDQFLSEKHERYLIISNHAFICKWWKEDVAFVRRRDLRSRRTDCGPLF